MIPAFMLKNGQVSRQDSLSEFGFYSSVFTRNEKDQPGKRTMIENQVLGTLMRTKTSHNNEGGVSAGYAVIDNPLVIPDSQFFSENGVKGLVLH